MPATDPVNRDSELHTTVYRSKLMRLPSSSQCPAFAVGMLRGDRKKIRRRLGQHVLEQRLALALGLVLAGRGEVLALLE